MLTRRRFVLPGLTCTRLQRLKLYCQVGWEAVWAPQPLLALLHRLVGCEPRHWLAFLVCFAEDDAYDVDRSHNLNLLAAMCTEVRQENRHGRDKNAEGAAGRGCRLGLFYGSTPASCAELALARHALRIAVSQTFSTHNQLQVDHREREVAAPVDLLGAFRAHEVGATTTFTAPLQLTKNVTIQARLLTAPIWHCGFYFVCVAPLHITKKVSIQVCGRFCTQQSSSFCAAPLQVTETVTIQVPVPLMGALQPWSHAEPTLFAHWGCTCSLCRLLQCPSMRFIFVTIELLLLLIVSWRHQQVKMSGKTKQEKFPGPATETEAQAEQGMGETLQRASPLHLGDNCRQQRHPYPPLPRQAVG